MKTTTKKLENICTKYCAINHNSDNYSIGGGLDGDKFASRRHEDAKDDEGKLTIGEAAQLFKKATGLEIQDIREVLKYAVPNMEWHHAGKLPKSYGGGMKKTYFLNAKEICNVAKNWDDFVEKLALSKASEKEADENKKSFEQRKHDFLKANAKNISRTTTKPAFFYQTAQEMNGKFGWFDSSSKSYNMTEYFSGWEFENQEMYNQFFMIN